ncbi:MAG: SIS domain-containing protein [Candidatus Heimdallarchaeaceae archaeon]
MTDYMLQEINEQPLYLRNLITQSKETIYEVVSKLKDKKNIRRIVLTGCGDSLCASLTTEAAFNKAGFSTFASPPMEISRYKYRFHDLLDENTLLIPISVSGKTPRVIEAINAAKNKNCSILSITNNPESPVAQNSDEFIYAKSSKIESLQATSYDGEISSKYVGYEHDVPQTKSYTAVQMALLLLAKSFEKNPDYSELNEIPNTIEKIVGNPLIKELGIESADASPPIFSASGPNYGNALFGEFKLYEFSLPGFSKEIEEYCHTAYFITEKNTPVMFIAPEGESLLRISEITPVLQNIIGANSIVLSKNEPSFDHWHWIEIPFQGSEEFSVIPYGVVAPLFAYWIAKEKGLNVNTFRGGVEQEKYVEGSYYTIRESKIKDDY